MTGTGSDGLLPGRVCTRPSVGKRLFGTHYSGDGSKIVRMPTIQVILEGSSQVIEVRG